MQVPNLDPSNIGIGDFNGPSSQPSAASQASAGMSSIDPMQVLSTVFEMLKRLGAKSG